MPSGNTEAEIHSNVNLVRRSSALRLVRVFGLISAFVTCAVALAFVPCAQAVESSSELSSKSLESKNAGINLGNESDDEIDYDTIVNSLEQQNHRDQEATNRLATKKATQSTDPFSNVWMHGGFGWATSYESLSDARGRELQLNHKGIQASLGIDLFSPNWEAEGSALSMGDATDRDDTVSLKEFDLKLFYKNRLTNTAKFRVGGGVSGRYMNVRMNDGTSLDYTTPAAVATVGLDLFVNRQFSFGVDTSFRNSLIADTVDHTSLDAVFRMDARF